MKTVKGQSKENDKNKGVPAKGMAKKGMGVGVKKPMKGSAKKMGC